MSLIWRTVCITFLSSSLKFKQGTKTLQTADSTVYIYLWQCVNHFVKEKFSNRNIYKFHMKNLILTLRRYRQLKLEIMSNLDAIFVSKYDHVTECFLATLIMAKGPFPSNRAGPLSGINFSCVHMVVFIPLGGMKFDWYVYLIVWKINYAIPSTHSLLNMHQLSVSFSWLWNSIYLEDCW